uniref:KRAB domain-containing protein n=1 Tax=Chrysemys picta bellii TaxID=8478 RepID=A0A8C3F5P7_CHRPI
MGRRWRVMFADVTVHFTRELYRDTMMENYGNVASLGKGFSIILADGSHQDSKPQLMAHTLHNYNRTSELYFIFLASDTRMIHSYK